jgi:hypothetical protein
MNLRIDVYKLRLSSEDVPDAPKIRVSVPPLVAGADKLSFFAVQRILSRGQERKK